MQPKTHQTLAMLFEIILSASSLYIQKKHSFVVFIHFIQIADSYVHDKILCPKNFTKCENICYFDGKGIILDVGFLCCWEELNILIHIYEIISLIGRLTLFIWECYRRSWNPLPSHLKFGICNFYLLIIDNEFAFYTHRG